MIKVNLFFSSFSSFQYSVCLQANIEAICGTGVYTTLLGVRIGPSYRMPTFVEVPKCIACSMKPIFMNNKREIITEKKLSSRHIIVHTHVHRSTNQPHTLVYTHLNKMLGSAAEKNTLAPSPPPVT